MARYTWAAMLTLLATTALPTYGADSTSADVQAITAIEHGWTDAMKAQDYAFLEKHLSEDFTYTGETGGFAKDRTAYIENGAKKAPKIVEISMSDELVRVHGTTAVATGRLSGKDENGAFSTRYTDTFAKGPDGWKAIASQETTTK